MSIEDDVRLLERVQPLRLLGIEALRVLAIGSETRQLQRNETLFQAGDAADAAFVVQSGAIRVFCESEPVGHQEVTAEPGDLIGELALLIPMERPSTAVAVRESSVIRITRSLFQRVLEGHPDSAARLRDDLAARNSRAAQDMMQAARKLV